MLPWTTRTGRFSPLRAVTFAGVLAPGLVIAATFLTATDAARPITDAEHDTGLWALRLLLVTLLVTPARRISGWNRLATLRRMLGVATAVYAVVHFLLYIADQDGRLGFVASEIVSRAYLAIGFVALAGLVALLVTSTDGAIRRLGRNWGRLHRLVYLIAPLGILHFCLQSRLDVSEPMLMAGLYVALMLCRLAVARGVALDLPAVAAIALLSALATAGLELLWYGLATGVPVVRVFDANFTLRSGIRPAWLVLGVTLVPLLASQMSRRMILGLFGRGATN